MRRAISIGASVVIWRTFACDQRAQDGVAQPRAGVDGPGVGFDAEVEQAGDQREALRLGRDHDVEPQIGEGDALPPALHVAEQALRIAREARIAGRRAHRIVAEARARHGGDEAPRFLEVVRADDDRVLQAGDGRRGVVDGRVGERTALRQP